MNAKQKTATRVAALALVVSLVIVPAGRPYTYGRVLGSHYAAYWTLDGGDVIDSTRIWMQFLVIGALWAAAYHATRDQ